jgi:hypothetical protein
MLLSSSRLVAAIAMACVASACAHVGKTATGEKSGPNRAGASASTHQRRVLNEGYSLLYQDAGNLDASELILYVKAESDAMNKTVTAVAEFGGELKRDLERLAKSHRGMRLDLDPLPEMEKRKRAAISHDRARYFAPVVGHGGREYERTVLIGFWNGINHERHLCQVMAAAEPDPTLKKFLLETEKRYDALYERVDELLNKEYFRDPNGKSRD